MIENHIISKICHNFFVSTLNEALKIEQSKKQQNHGNEAILKEWNFIVTKIKYYPMIQNHSINPDF